MSQPARLPQEKLQNSARDKASKYRKMWDVEPTAVLGTYPVQWKGLPSDPERRKKNEPAGSVADSGNGERHYPVQDDTNREPVTAQIRKHLYQFHEWILLWPRHFLQ